jgi:membrane-associated phospholipid phosphatase
LGYALYAWIRDREGAASYSTAVTNAVRVLDVERVLHLDQERNFQQFLLHWPDMVRVLDTFWSYGYLVGTVAVMAWIGLRHRHAYRRLRRSFVLATGVALVVFAVYPTVPPRLLPPAHGIVDTWMTVGGVAAHTPPNFERIADPFASMPSLHVAWSVWAAAAILSQLPRTGTFRRGLIRIVAVVYPVLTAMCVVATGNHLVLDCLAGAALVPLSLAGLDRVARRYALREARSVIETVSGGSMAVAEGSSRR